MKNGDNKGPKQTGMNMQVICKMANGHSELSSLEELEYSLTESVQRRFTLPEACSALYLRCTICMYLRGTHCIVYLSAE